jgi:hypothetical protein
VRRARRPSASLSGKSTRPPAIACATAQTEIAMPEQTDPYAIQYSDSGRASRKDLPPEAMSALFAGRHRIRALSVSSRHRALCLATEVFQPSCSISRPRDRSPGASTTSLPPCRSNGTASSDQEVASRDERCVEKEGPDTASSRGQMSFAGSGELRPGGARIAMQARGVSMTAHSVLVPTWTQLSSQSMGVLRFGPCDGAITLPSGPITGLEVRSRNAGVSGRRSRRWFESALASAAG